MSELAQNVQQEEQLDISIQRVDKNSSPLLVIGLGGTGAGIVHTIKRVFAQRFNLPKTKDGETIPVPPRTAYLVLDTDKDAKGDLDNHEFLNLTVQGLSDILDPSLRNFNLKPYEQSWVNRNLTANSNGMGANGNRQAGRLMLSRHFEDVVNRISSLLRNISTVQHGDAEELGQIQIIICTGICGGTGSGTFLDVPQIVRHCIATTPGLAGRPYRITGFIVMPDISLLPVTGTSAADLLQMNGYAALKELDFWMNLEEHKTPYAMQYTDSVSVSWDRPPFDACALMSGTTVDGVVLKDTVRVVRETIAENLLHYMADELPPAANDGMQQFGYRNYEDNLDNYIETMAKRLPLNYAYRAVGAYTKRIPKKKILYYEGKLLFETFIPPRDEYERLVPSDQLLTDGKTLERAQEIVGKAANLYNNFKQIVRLPASCGVSANDKVKIENMQKQSIKPHETVDVKPTLWASSNVRPGASKAANEYLDAAWDRFSAFANSVISDPHLGPFALEAYLKDPKGLLPQLREASTSWDSNAKNFRAQANTNFNACGATWNDFVHPPVLTRTKALTTYLDNLRNYFDAVRKTIFMEVHAAALHKLVKRVEEYLRDALTPLCEDILKLDKEFKAVHAADANRESDLADVTLLQPKIQAQFTAGNANNQMSREFLGDLHALSMATAPSVTTDSSGVAFTYRLNGFGSLLEQISTSLNRAYQNVNNDGLDELMIQSVGTDVAEQNRYMDNLAKQITASAKPLYNKAASYNDEIQSFIYLSVPEQGAEQHVQYYKDTLDNKYTPSESKLNDHIYCINALDGLPVCSYGLMGSIEKAYAEKIIDPRVSMGAHLVREGSPDQPFTADWSKLPDPAPYYFFREHGQGFMESSYAHTHGIVDRAIDCGMIEIDDSQKMPRYTIHMFYADARRQGVVPSDALKAQLKTLLDTKTDPVTGSAYSPAQMLSRLEAFRNQATAVELAPGRNPDCLQAYLGLTGQKCDPNDQTIAFDENAKKEARANHSKLCREFASAVIARRPQLEAMIAQQLDGYEAIVKAGSAFEDDSKKWQPRLAYAPAFARMYMHGLINYVTGKAHYRTETGENPELILPSFLKEDLDGAAALIRDCGYLADLSADNGTRMLLEHQLNVVEREMMSRELNAEESASLTTAATKLSNAAEKEAARKRTAKLGLGADVARLDEELKILNSMKKAAQDMIDALSSDL